MPPVVAIILGFTSSRELRCVPLVSILLAYTLLPNPYVYTYTGSTRELGISFGEKYSEVKDTFDCGKYYGRKPDKLFSSPSVL